MSNVIFAPSNATYHTDSGSHSVDSYASGYSSRTVDALSQFGYNGTSSGGLSSGSNADLLSSVLGSGSSIDKALNRIANTSGSDFGDILREAMETAAGNSALSQSYAREQMAFQRESDQYAMNWSALEAQKTRDWQTEMSNTAHQRQVSDLVAAGLNPILSANGGASSPTGATGSAYSSSGAQGTVDTSASALFSSLLNTAINLKSIQSQENLALAQMASNERISSLNADASIRGHQISSAATLGAAYANADAARYGYDVGATNVEKQLNNALRVAGIQGINQRYVADRGYEGTTYSSDRHYDASVDSADISNQRPSGVAGGIWNTLKDAVRLGMSGSTVGATSLNRSNNSRYYH